jgi:hypothetical protein
MRKQTKKAGVFLTSAVVLLLGGLALIASVPVYALDGTTSRESTMQTEPVVNDETAGAKNIKAHTTEVIQQRKEDARKKLCENRKDVTQKIMDRVAQRGTQRLNLISKNSDNIQAFVTKKNLTVPNYDSLLATISAKKTAAQAAINAVTSSKESFTCDSSQPGGTLKNFNGQVKAQNQALLAYRESVKNLLRAVKTTVKATGGNTNASQ